MTVLVLEKYPDIWTWTQVQSVACTSMKKRKKLDKTTNNEKKSDTVNGAKKTNVHAMKGERKTTDNPYCKS